ncbi:MAG: menaquinone-specific isochorismate synthase [Actinomycetota bacterium]|nr:menaquinone-specific isochorismate synthase [Actinomycetota bacterium]
MGVLPYHRAQYAGEIEQRYTRTVHVARHPAAGQAISGHRRRRGATATDSRTVRNSTDADGDGEWGIALRCGAYDGPGSRQMRLFAGCGIVAGSDPASELAESDAKFVPMRDALTAD